MAENAPIKKPERRFALNFNQKCGNNPTVNGNRTSTIHVDSAPAATSASSSGSNSNSRGGGSFYRNISFMTAGQKYAARREAKKLDRDEQRQNRLHQQRGPKRSIEHVDLGDDDLDVPQLQFGAPAKAWRSGVSEFSPVDVNQISHMQVERRPAPNGPEPPAHGTGTTPFARFDSSPVQGGIAAKQTAFVVPARHETLTHFEAPAGSPPPMQHQRVGGPVASVERLAYTAVTGNKSTPLLVNRHYRAPMLDAHPQTSTDPTRPLAASTDPRPAGEIDPLKIFDANILELINNEIMCSKTNVSWNDISGLEKVKQALREIVVWPFLRPDLFHGLRAPAKGVLLFGPPGTGKTMIGRCVACECKATFFNISASSITSKWVGEGEKLVRALFAVARTKLPAVIFIDEIDSILSSRSDSEHESSRRIKTEFLVQLDGVSTSADERLLVLAATNRPQELDDAARRRFTKRLYVGLPSKEARISIIKTLIRTHKHSLTDEQLDNIADITDGYSGADMRCLCQETAFEPLRSLGDKLADIPIEEIRPICHDDFETALKSVRPTVTESDLEAYDIWNRQFGAILN